MEKEPGNTLNTPLSARDSCLAMLNGEVLVDEYGSTFKFDDSKGFIKDNDDLEYPAVELAVLYRRSAKRRRRMTSEEVNAWAESEDSTGWMVRVKPNYNWHFPRAVIPYGDTSVWERARILSDLSGIDESTIQGFEVEE
jgi:hypothetical protein